MSMKNLTGHFSTKKGQGVGVVEGTLNESTLWIYDGTTWLQLTSGGEPAPAAVEPTADELMAQMFKDSTGSG